jgi:hypothetical protein
VAQFRSAGAIYRTAAPPGAGQVGGSGPERDLDALTSRELEVLALIGLGKTNGEIAAQLFVSEDTGKRGCDPHVARRSDQPSAANTHTGSNHQALTPAAWTSSAVSARATTTATATRQSSPTTKSYQNAPIDLSRFMSW